MSLISHVFWLCYLDYYFQYFIYLVVFGFQTFMLWYNVFFGFWFGYVLFMSLVGYALYFEEYPVLEFCFPGLHYYIWFDSQVLWLFYVAKGGEKWGVERLRKNLEIKWSSIPKHRGSERAIYYAYTLLACILISRLILSS